MKKTTIAKKLASLPGFRKNGLFYIGKCNDDVMVGYCLDAPPRNIYICRFVLPIYDNIDFLHLSLGKRILALPHTQNGDEGDVDITAFLVNDWTEFSTIKDRRDLISYIDNEDLKGTYVLWVKYITHIKNREFVEADYLSEAEGANKKFLEIPAVRDSFVSICKEREVGDWEGCFTLLDTWACKTKATYCHDVGVANNAVWAR